MKFPITLIVICASMLVTAFAETEPTNNLVAVPIMEMLEQQIGRGLTPSESVAIRSATNKLLPQLAAAQATLITKAANIVGADVGDIRGAFPLVGVPPKGAVRDWMEELQLTLARPLTSQERALLQNAQDEWTSATQAPRLQFCDKVAGTIAVSPNRIQALMPSAGL